MSSVSNNTLPVVHNIIISEFWKDTEKPILSAPGVKACPHGSILNSLDDLLLQQSGKENEERQNDTVRNLCCSDADRAHPS
jgi:hypothetical protein